MSSSCSSSFSPPARSVRFFWDRAMCAMCSLSHTELQHLSPLATSRHTKVCSNTLLASHQSCCQVVLAQLVTCWFQVSSRVSARQAAPVFRPYRLQTRAGESQRNPGVTKKRSTGPPFLPPVTPKVQSNPLLPFAIHSR